MGPAGIIWLILGLFLFVVVIDNYSKSEKENKERQERKAKIEKRENERMKEYYRIRDFAIRTTPNAIKKYTGYVEEIQKNIDKNAGNPKDLQNDLEIKTKMLKQFKQMLYDFEMEKAIEENAPDEIKRLCQDTINAKYSQVVSWCSHCSELVPVAAWHTMNARDNPRFDDAFCQCEAWYENFKDPNKLAMDSAQL